MRATVYEATFYVGLIAVFFALPSLSQDPTQTAASCVAANYTQCCIDGDCLGVPPSDDLPQDCYCDEICYSLSDCCHDISQTCVRDEMPFGNNIYLIFTNNVSILRINPDGSGLLTIVDGLSGGALGIEYHSSRGVMFWSDTVENTIYQANLNGTDMRVLLNESLEVVEDLATDWVNNKLYFTDALHTRIEVIDLDQPDQRVELLRTGESTIPRSIAVDPRSRHMYWSDWGLAPKIEQASMDGAARIVVIDTDLDQPWGITIDYSDNKLYWVDASLDKIEYSNLDGTNRITLETGDDGVLDPFAITIQNNLLFWTETGNMSIFTTHKLIGKDILALTNGLTSAPGGIEAVTPDRQPQGIENPCDGNQCSDVCLLSSDTLQGYTCACPRGGEVMEDGITCNFTNATPEPSVPPGSCVRAGFDDCCISGSCLGIPPNCYCDFICISLGDCCSDIALICTEPTPPPTPPPSEDFLPFLELDVTDGVQAFYLGAVDDDSQGPIPISAPGFPFGNSIQTTSYVGSNGVISFGAPYFLNFPNAFPGAFSDQSTAYVVAPFWDDVDARMDGDIFYEVHEAGLTDTSDDYLSEVSAFISSTSSVDFQGTWMLVAQWDAVHPYPHGAVGGPYEYYYQYYIDYYGDVFDSNTYQGIVITDGNNSFAVFTYRCDDLQWSRGAIIGYNAAGDFFENHDFRGDFAESIDCINLPNSNYSNVVYQLSIEDITITDPPPTIEPEQTIYLDFLDRAPEAALNENKTLPACDDCSSPAFDIADTPFPLGQYLHSRFYVGNNGIVSMGREFPLHDAAPFPTELADTFYTYVAAPFWGDADTRKAGEVYYEVHATGTPASDDLINQVNAFLQTEEGVMFAGNWMLVVHWDAVHPWPHGKPGSTNPVLEATNTYQAVLITDGSKSYAVYIYKCGLMGWSDEATIGWNGGGELYANHPLSGLPAANEIACVHQTQGSDLNNVVYDLVPGELLTGQVTPPPLNSTGSCVLAGYTQCCDGDDCTGSRDDCSCNQLCYTLSSCCHDIAITCPRQVLCSDPIDIDNGMVTFTGTSVGDSAAYSCDSGLSLIGGANTTCTQLGANFAAFSPAPPLCRLLCSDPVDIDNGMVTFTGTSIGENAAYSCDSGFQLIGVATTTCTQVDVNSAVFSPTPPFCRDFLSYIQLDTTPGVTRTFVTGDDACSGAIDIPVGFPLGSMQQTTGYVCTNGYISFGNPETDFSPSLFPGSSVDEPGVAPFWANLNVNNGGSVSYEIHTNITSLPLLSQVNQFIRSQQQNKFAGIWMLVAEWNSVPRFGTTTPTNTFQALIITSGFQSYTVFTYQCDDINWGGGATIGFKADLELYANHPSSGSAADSIDCQDSASWNNVIYQLHMQYLTFINLGATSVFLPSFDDGASNAIDIPGGFPFGDSTQTSVYVITNGYLSLGRIIIDFSPELFPATDFLIAPFWSDVDISSGVGEISYEVHSLATVEMNVVSTFISQQQEINFTGTWMLVTYWNNVPEFIQSTTITNTYQGILITDGQSSFAVFIYNCNQMGWTGNSAASIGFDTDGSFYQNHFLSRSINASSVACLNSPDTEWSFVIYQLHGSVLPFLELGNTSGVTQTFLASDLDGSSDLISIPEFRFGTTNQTFVYVITNGFFSFGRSYTNWIPSLFPTFDNEYLVAPFWADHDIRDGGQVSFEVHTSDSGTPTALLTHVSTFIRQQLQNDFRGTWMLVAEWADAPHYINSVTTNTYQGIVITDGTQSFAVYIYKCGAMTWPGPNPATIGFNTDGSLFANYALSGTNSVHEVACQSYPDTVWNNLVYSIAIEEIPVDIYTSPSGPDYQAATYITVFCNASGGSDLYTYTWRVYCSATGILMFESAADSSDSFQLKSTPPVCFDRVECVVEDTVLPLAGSASVTITSVVGVGIFANDNPAVNNSAVLADSSNQIGTIYCTSGSRDSTNGQWFAPDGTQISAGTTSSLTVVYGGGNFPGYIGLQLNSGSSLTASEEGVYTCIILDEDGIQQTLYVGIYRYGFSTVPSVLNVTSMSHPLFTINCATSGAPALVTWLYLVSDVFLTYQNDEGHQIVHSLQDGTTATYNSAIAFTFTPVNETGIHVCFAQTTYISSDSAETNTSTATDIRYFGLYAVGEFLAVNCADNAGTATLLQWLDDSGNIVASSNGGSVFIQITPVTDVHNGQVYRCRLYSGAVLQDDRAFPIISFFPVSEPIIVQIELLSTSAPIAGSSFSLSCVAVDSSNGISSIPLIEWTGPNGNPATNGEGITVGALVNESTVVTQTITYDSIRISHSGPYTCTATLDSPALTIPYVAMTSQVVTVSAPAPILVITQTNGPHYVGSSLTITCIIVLHPAVDTGVNLSASWTGPDGTLLSNSSRVTISDAILTSPQTYWTAVTVIGLSSIDAGSYTCNATLTPELSYVTGSSASTATNVVVEDFALQVDVLPISLSILDAEPYNSFTLTCTVTVPASVQVAKVIEWSRSFQGSSSPLSHNGDTVMITNSDLSTVVTTSVLVTSENAAGNVSYICTSTVLEVTGSNSAIIQVQGPIPPEQPTGLGFDDITYISAVLEWTIPYVSYTPENYQVRYGLTEANLDQASQIVDGGTDLVSTNQVFSVGLTGLLPNTTYYWIVVADNSFTTTESSIGTFLTVPLPLVVSIGTNGSSVAGETFTLTCRAIEEANITGTPELLWIFPDNYSGIGVSVGDSETTGRATTLILQFSPLSVYHEGQYTCQAYLSSIDLLRMAAHNVTVSTQTIAVQITSTPSGPDHHAATSLNLSCGTAAANVYEPAMYEWISTCTGDCFLLGSTDATVTRSVLRSTDSGSHTCSVTDAVGNTGAATIDVNVFGVGIHYEGTGLLPNNSFVTADSSATVQHLQCSSGSSVPNVGNWIAPSGQDITTSSTDPFDVIVGGDSNPGYLSILQASGHFLTASFQGIYTCILPDENGVERQLNVGVYPNGFNAPPTVTSLERTAEISSVFTLSCVSTQSPATTVTWTRDGVSLSSDSTYRMAQILVDRAAATYDNQLSIDTGPYGTTGNYSCSVSNSLGSDSANIAVNGLQIAASNILFTVGETASLTCSSDLDISSIEWLYSGQLVANSTGQQQLELVFSQVNDTIHDREYTCRVTSPYGTQEDAHLVIAEVPADRVVVNISAEGNPFAGQQYRLTCIVTYPAGIANPIEVEWRDASGPITSGEGTSVGDVMFDGTMITTTLEFSPLRVAHEGLVICEATVDTTALPFSLVQIAELDINVQVVDELQITISSNPETGTYLAGSSVTLTCNVNGGHLPLMYEWNSTCDRDCFIDSQTTASVVQDILHSVDSGNHTCLATDFVGHTGSASIEMVITGASLYLEGTGLLQNNSLILATSTGRVGQVQCVSGSTTPNVGAWIAPNGMDITFKNDDVFDIVVGDASDPGYLSVQLPNGVSLSETDWGVYTCIIPDEAENLQYLHLGIYPQDFTTFPSITSLQILESSTSLTLECISAGSPATDVVWSRDGTGLQTNDFEYTNQILRNGTTASYSTVVTLAGVLCTLSGTYGCTVQDSLGQNSMTATVEVEAISITGNRGTLSVGDTITITCSTDLDAIAVQWYYNSNMIVNSPGSLADLVFNPVNDSIHNREYVCTVLTSSCSIDQATTVTVQVPDRAITVSVVSTALPVAGNNYTLTCTVTLTNGLSGFPEVMWLNSDGQEIVSEGDTTVYGPLTSGLITTLILEFDPLRIRDEGFYTCDAVYSSPILATEVNSSATEYIDVELVQPLLVSIVDTANLAQDFLYTPGSTVMLNCVVQGAIEPVIYEWTSTCRSDCFVLNQLSSSVVEKEIIHSIDSGNHTCMVLDDVGNSGASTIEMQVVGASFYSFNPENSGLFPNNGIIVTDNFGQTDRIQCISGSQTPDVGRWITPDGQDVTRSSDDQFEIIVGGVNDPGYLDIILATGRSLTHDDQGVYTCLIPDETGATQELHVGLYLPGFAVAVGIVSLQESSTFSSAFVINCTSDGSPPTNVTWYKNEEVLEGSDTYQMVQILTNAATATFDNLLVVYTEPASVLGTYSCFIENTISPSTQESITFEGVQIIGNATLIVGQTATTVCSTDLQVEKLEWIYSKEVVANSSSQGLDLHFDIVYNYYHNREYTCRATTSYGILEEIVIFTVQIPPSALIVSVTTVGNSVAGESYELVCTASVIEGIEATPQSLQWLDTDGQQIQSDSDISVGTARLENGAVILPLQFGVLRVSHTGEYTCQATVFLPGFDPIVTMTSSNVDVETIELDVTIVSTVSGPVLNVAEPLTLSCQAMGGTEEYSYQWSSTCTGSCFITDQMSQSVTRDALRSSDSGNHTCAVLDNAGNSGTASVTISVIGVGLHSVGAFGQVSNNSILFANGNGRIPQLQCLSGSTVPSVGRWLSPDGSDLLNITGDPFEITVGSDSDPGSVVIETPAVNIPLSQNDEGVYTCIIPDEVEEVRYLHIGIYLNGFNMNPAISSLQRVTNSTTLTCTSTGSPATTVMWTKDGVTLNNDAGYQISQILTDGTTSMYSNLLYIFLDPDDIIGLYSCRVINQIEFSSSETYLIQGLQITGNDAVLPVGQSASLTCSSDLDVSSIEWVYSGQVVARSTNRQDLELEFDPVNDTIHGREYTCRVTSPYGSQERSVVTTVAILDPMALRVSTNAVGNRTAGNPYTINCLATKLEGLLATPEIIWLDPDGNSINNGEDITVYPLVTEGNVTISQIEISTLETSDGGQYTCAVSLDSPALETPLTATAVTAVTVQIPTPTVTVSTASDAPLLAGSSLILECSAEVSPEVDTNISINFTWRRSGETLSSDSRITVSMTTQVRPMVYQSELLFNTLSQTTDPGEYTCEVTIVSGPPSVYIDSATGLDRVNLAIQSPILEVVVAPTSVIVLDIAPYNTFILTCTATQPSSVTLNKTIEWRESRNGVTQAIIEDGNSVNITTTGLHDPTTTSLLSVNADTAAESILSCVASLQVPEDQLISQSSNAPVTVIGPMAPVQPVDLVLTTAASDFVIVQWVVPYIAYTPETYVVQYGTTENFLTNTSDVVSGSSDITVTNQLYSVRLSSLEPLTDYFYRVVAMNSFSSNASEMATFTTSSPVLTASVRTEGNSTAGEILTLICSVEVSEETPGVPTIEWRRAFDNSRVISEESITVGNPLTIGQITTVTLEFSPIKTSHGGQYTCRANISSPLEGLQTVFVTEDVIVQIPSPTVSISGLPDTSLYTGTTLILTCTIELHETVDTPVVLTGTWRRSGDLIANTSRAHISEVIQNSVLVYQTSLSLIPLSSILDSGQYECESLVRPDSGSEFVAMGRGSDTLSASVEALPGPSIVISSEGTPTAGEVYTLTCTFSVIDGLVDSATILSYWSDSNSNTITAEDTLLLAPTVTGTTTMLPLQFSQLRTSYAGQYFCRASISIPEISAQQNSSLGQTVVVQIPEPAVAVLSTQDDNLLSGTYLRINCSIDLNPAVDTQVTITNLWLRNGMDISDNSRVMVSQPSETESHHYEAYIEFSTLSSAVDSGTYICAVTATPSTLQEYITSGFGSASYMITVADPVITVDVTPLSYTGLDTEPYNAFSLTCMATKPTEVIPNISLTWFHNGTQLDTSVLGVSISEDESSSGAMKSSQLSVDADDPSDSGSYSCQASLAIPESDTVESSQASLITIIGPTLPAAPMPLDNITTTASSAVVSWLVGSITYTPESYTVVYGLSADTLNNTTEAIQGTMDVAAVDMVYSTTIGGLAAFRQYYYRIIAANSFRSTQSSINTFCTMMSAPTAPPELFQAVSISARSASLSWELPVESGRNGIIISYSVACTDAQSNPIISDEVTETSFTVEGLQPYSQYNCTVAASTSVGEGPPAYLTFDTLEDAPEDAPTNVTVVDISSSSVLVTWTAPSLPNGIIVHYTLYVDYADGSAIVEVNTLSVHSNYTIDDLQPYQLVRVQVSASTAAGEGPLSTPAMGRASEEAITAAEVSILMASEDAPVAGELYTLLCTVTVQDGLISDPQIMWLDPTGLPLSSEGGITIATQPVLDAPFEPRLTTYSLSFSPLFTSHGGPYTCHATVTSPQQTLQETSSAVYNLTVQIPSPSTMISGVTSVSQFAGSSLELVCTVELVAEVDTGFSVVITWNRSGEQINSSDRISVSTATEVGASIYQSELQIDILSQIIDDGDYSCDATVSSSPQLQYVQDATGSDLQSIVVQTPTLEVVITPTSVTVLDVAPYNIFVLTCTATQPSSVSVTKTIEWRETRNGVTEAIIADNSSANITNNDLGSPTSTSHLSVRLNDAGDRVISCTAILQVPEDPAVSLSASAEVTVKGPSEPAQPTSVSVSDITSESISLQWVIPYIAYTPEEYRVLYGNSQQSLDQAGNTIGPATNLTATNMSYTSAIMGLRPGVQYYIRVDSENSILSSMSEVINATTLEAPPSGMPLDFSVIPTSPRSLEFSWNPPSDTERNGIITGYTLSCQPNVEGLPQVYPSAGTYTVDGVYTPAAQYNCSVFASNSAGNGPPAYEVQTTPEDAPSGPPLDFTISPAGPRTFQFSWSPPAEPDRNGIIISYNLTCQPDVEGLPVTFSDAGTYTLDGFVISTQYNCSLSASTSAGDGPAATQEETAPEYPPSGPPLNFTIMAAGTTALEFSWSPPAEENRNGFITGYTLSCQPPSEQLPADFSDTGEQTLDGFIPGTEYICSIAASTSVGIGPQMSTMGSTEDDIPGEVTALNVTAVADTILYVSWSEPLITNGIILFYNIIVESTTATVDNRSVNSLDVTINVLNPYVPYTVSVSASTSAGAGQSIQMIVFTREGAPNVPPKNIAAARLNGTHMNVTWGRLTPAEARGFLTGYTITYDILEKQQRKKRQILTEEVGPNESYKVIGNLELTTSYLVTVSASTTGGKGVDSEDIAAEPPPSSLFQLRLTGVPDCNIWRFDDTDNRVSEIKSAIVMNLQQYCSCSVTVSYITSAELSCPEEPEEVIFRARIYSTPDASNTVLISSLQQWIAIGPSIVIQLNRLDLDAECDVEIQSFIDPICPKATSPPPQVTTVDSAQGEKEGISIGIIVGAAVGGVGVIIAVILAVYIFYKLRRRREYKIRDRNNRLVHLSERDETYVQMQPTFNLSLSNSGAFSGLSASGDYARPPGFYTNAGAAADDPPTPPPKKGAALSASGQAEPNEYVSLPAMAHARNPFSLNSDTDEYVKMGLGPTPMGEDDDSLYEHIPGDPKSQ